MVQWQCFGESCDGIVGERLIAIAFFSVVGCAFFLPVYYKQNLFVSVGEEQEEKLPAAVWRLASNESAVPGDRTGAQDELHWRKRVAFFVFGNWMSFRL